MKTLAPILAFVLIIAAFFGGYHVGQTNNTPSPQHLTLEEVLSIKELHLVKHVYQDLFFIHRKNNPRHAIRAIVQVPVEITAYINLKETQVIYENDSVRAVILPHAVLNLPNYQLDKMIVRETRAFQVHAGKDLYPLVADYFKTALAARMDTLRHTALANRIVTQAEEEGREYVEGLLSGIGRHDIIVTVGAAPIKESAMPPRDSNQPSTKQSAFNASLEVIPFGFIPLR